MSTRFNIRTRREEYMLPGTTDEILMLIRSILTGGGVQRLVLEMGRPVIVHRAVKDEEELAEEELDFDAVLRHVTMFEYKEDSTSFLAIFDVCQMMRVEKIKPVYMVTSQNRKVLQDWLGVEMRQMIIEEESILGIPIRRLKSLPDETLVICGSPYADAEPADITIAVKITMETKHEKVEQVAGRSGGNSEGSTSADGNVGNSAGGSIETSRSQESDIGGREESETVRPKSKERRRNRHAGDSGNGV